jgi:hypothetical protein
VLICRKGGWCCSKCGKVAHYEEVLVDTTNQKPIEMIKTISQKNYVTEIDLTGPDSNAFALLAYAKKFCKQMGLTEEEGKAVLDEMRAGDYENLIQVFEKHFGSFIILYR